MTRKSFLAITLFVMALFISTSTRAQEPFAENINDSIIKKPEHQIFFEKGLNALNNNDYEKALMAFQESKKINPKNINTYVYEAFTLKKLNSPLKEIDVLTKAISVFPNNATLYHTLGIAYLLNNQRSNSLEQLRIFQSMEPNNPEAYFALGNVYAVLNKITKSNYNYLKAASLYKKNNNKKKSECFINAGINYFNTKNYKEATDYFDKALKIDSNSGKAVFYKGLSIFKQDSNNSKKFKQLTQKAIDLGFIIPEKLQPFIEDK